MRHEVVFAAEAAPYKVITRKYLCLFGMLIMMMLSGSAVLVGVIFR